MWYRGPFSWQTNSSVRAFEFPWAWHAISAAGPGPLKILEIGGGMSGLQFVLARAGNQVVNVDPGLAARGRGWPLDRELHGRLCDAYAAPVQLISSSDGAAGLPGEWADVVLCVSTLEHVTDHERAGLASEIRRVLRPGGLAVVTVDLFLDLTPFSAVAHNQWGSNIDLSRLMEDWQLELVAGDRRELLGCREFTPKRIKQRLGEYLIAPDGVALAQCFVGRRPMG